MCENLQFLAIKDAVDKKHQNNLAAQLSNIFYLGYDQSTAYLRKKINKGAEYKRGVVWPNKMAFATILNKRNCEIVQAL